MSGKIPYQRALKFFPFYSECNIIYRNLNKSNRSKCKDKMNSSASRQQITAFPYMYAKHYTKHLAWKSLSPKHKLEFQ